MRYELSDTEWGAIRLKLPNKPRGVVRVDDRGCSQWHLLGIAVRRPVARPSGRLWPSHDLLQSICSLAARRSLDEHHERTERLT